MSDYLHSVLKIHAHYHAQEEIRNTDVRIMQENIYLDIMFTLLRKVGNTLIKHIMMLCCVMTYFLYIMMFVGFYL